MAFRAITHFLSSREPLPLRRAYWRGVSFRRLTSLLVAIFFLFGMVGCFVDLLDYGRKPLVPVFVWSVFSGFIAVVWIIAYFRDLRWLIVAVVLWDDGRVLSPSSCQVSARIRSPAPNSVPQSQRSLA